MVGAFSDWRPLHEAHSIEAAGITITFTQALTELPWRKVLTEARTTARRLGLTVERSVPTYTVAVGPETGFTPVAASTSAIPNVEFMRLRTPTFAEEKMIYDASSLRYESWAYTRWSAFLDRALDLMEASLSPYMMSVPIMSVAVDYLDKFYSADGVAAPDAGQVLDKASPLIAARAFRATEPWHAHSGWFETSDTRVKRLFNVDIDVGDISGRPSVGAGSPARVVQVRTAAIDHFNQPGSEETPNEDVTVAFTRDRLQIMHNELKAVLGSVLTHAAVAAIELEGEA